ncbi:Transposase DDE domain-containing protein [Paracoccus homiensis]|uniref:Transposase DDE domain-containing protein n=1 Tax=Paracoccus homiensis TaxID=364199 RepID=A0A1I0JJL8_9RHOB|nr:Transposase DDE domain-containing protein [Paracoccus homiensis]
MLSVAGPGRLNAASKIIASLHSGARLSLKLLARLKALPKTVRAIAWKGQLRMMENRSGLSLIVQADLTQANGRAERRAAIDMLHRHSPGSTRRLTLAADRGYDSADFVPELRQMVVTPNLTQKSHHSAIDGRTTRHPGYAKSQRCRKKHEEPFGWAKTVGGLTQTMYRGIEPVRARFTLTMAACNLARLPKLLAP